MDRVIRYMLDTNTVSHLIKRHTVVQRHVLATPMSSLSVSAITAGELLFGLANLPAAFRLHRAVGELLRRVDILAWNDVVAKRYGDLRADMERLGRVLAPLDMLIASHAVAADMVLVTNDRAFSQVAGLTVEDWTR
jgi:tRNA(fMet)-specific endonuclease VapC